MLPDHYATLGVAPKASRALIRAAYVKLMRNYHPDKNSSPAAAARVRAITAAYAVLSVREKRAQYDLNRARVGVAKAFTFTPERAQWQRWLPVPIGIVAIMLMVAALLPPPLIPTASSDQVTTVGGAPAIVPQQAIPVMATSSQGVTCTSPATSMLVKRELFRRAARLRGGDEAAYDRLSRYTLVRFDSPVLADPSGEDQTINCTAFVALDLPPGIAALDGRRSVSGKIGYSLRARDGGGARPTSLRADGDIIELLATLTQTRSVQPVEVDPSAAPNEELTSARPPSEESLPLPAQPAAPAWSRIQPQRPVSQQNPSFSCRVARDWAAMSVCESPTLAALDRRMASLYGDLMERADASTRALLVQTDGRFIARRDRCSSEACLHTAYLTAIQEIRDITARR